METTNLKEQVRDLVCGQVETFIEKVMKEDDTRHSVRKERLDGYGPRDFNSIGNLAENNDPLYWANMVDRLNTPFDHVDKILL